MLMVCMEQTIICQLLLVKNSAAVLDMTGANYYKLQAELVQLCSVGAVLKILTLKK